MNARPFTLSLALVTVLAAGQASAACTSPPGTEGDQFYNTSYHTMQFCNGTNWMNMGTGGITGIGTLTNGDLCTSDGTVINCTSAAVSLRRRFRAPCR